MSTSFPPATYIWRLDALAAAVRAADLSGAIITPGTDLAYLTGITGASHERFTGLVCTPSGEGTQRAVLICPKTDLGALTADHDLAALGITAVGWSDGEDPYACAAQLLAGAAAPAPVAISSTMTVDHFFALKSALPEAEWVDATTALASLFMRKQPDEVEWLTRAGAAIDRVFEQVPGLLTAGRTEREVAADIERLILVDHDSVDFIIVGSGENGANPHHSFSDRVLQAGEPVVVDLGGSMGPGYHSDCTRTFVVPGADPEPRFVDIYEVVRQAQEAAVEAVRPGRTAGEIDAIARDIITASEYGEYFFHRLGHGIGLAEHEPPFIIAGSDQVLEESMTFSIEPGIYIPGWAGVRIEDIVTVTADGARRLNTTSRALGGIVHPV
ncbi:MAG: aminopeptidase P family protein [Corynebacterium sp.]|nr:aminopeptidase P family protein [Corynebacterium sp.]